MKTCSKCGIKKQLSEFKKHKLHFDGVYSQCKLCVKSVRSTPEYRKKAWSSAKVWREKNPSKVKAWAKKFRESEHGKKYIKSDFLKRLYGVDLEVFNKMFFEQSGCCAICKKHQSELSRGLSVDHNHKTKEVRGLLCGKCNTALGLFDESTELLLIATQYLKRNLKGENSCLQLH